MKNIYTDIFIILFFSLAALETVNYRYVYSITGIGKNKPINNNQSVTSITKLITGSCTNEFNFILSSITQ